MWCFYCVFFFFFFFQGETGIRVFCPFRGLGDLFKEQGENLKKKKKGVEERWHLWRKRCSICEKKGAPSDGKNLPEGIVARPGRCWRKSSADRQVLQRTGQGAPLEEIGGNPMKRAGLPKDASPSSELQKKREKKRNSVLREVRSQENKVSEDMTNPYMCWHHLLCFHLEFNQAPCAQKIVRKLGTGFADKFTSYTTQKGGHCPCHTSVSEIVLKYRSSKFCIGSQSLAVQYLCSGHLCSE